MTIMEEAQTLELTGFSRDFNSRSRARSAGAQRFDAKRLLDIFGASAALILCAPVMLIIYLFLSLAGRPIFAQRRVGRDGATFRCFKFRTMVKNADQALADHLLRNPRAKEEWARAYKLADDPRITPFGRFLRKSSLDELPQLFNVLKGDMSLVGPRPIVPAETVRYARRIQAYHQCRPGITGLWQVNGRNLTSYRRRVALDSLYARKSSVGLDLFILFKTVHVVMIGKGAC